MRVVFAGTPPFAARALEAIVAAGHRVAAVYTQPDRPAGRGMKLAASAVSELAARLSIPVEKPASLKPAEAQARLRELAPDVMVVAAYGLILPPPALEIAPRGCLNIHASLLPRWRGAAPIQRALLAGDATTGICIMRMDAGLDTGPVLLERSLAIGPRDTAGSLTLALGALGAEAIVTALESLDRLSPQPQDEARATHAAKIAKAEARIDWSQPAVQIDRQVRAFDPAPGAEARLAGESFKVWQAEVVPDARGTPGEILALSQGDFIVACGTQGLNLRMVQRAGGRKMPAMEFARGTALAQGATLA